MKDYEAVTLAEAALRKAMLEGDVAALDDLLDDAVIYTDQSGNRLGKTDDLAVHRSGRLQIETIEAVDTPAIRLWGDCATVCLTADLAGLYDGGAFFGRFAYSRVWHLQNDRWSVVLAHCTEVAAAG